MINQGYPRQASHGRIFIEKRLAEGGVQVRHQLRRHGAVELLPQPVLAESLDGREMAWTWVEIVNHFLAVWLTRLKFPERGGKGGCSPIFTLDTSPHAWFPCGFCLVPLRFPCQTVPKTWREKGIIHFWFVTQSNLAMNKPSR